MNATQSEFSGLAVEFRNLVLIDLMGSRGDNIEGWDHITGQLGLALNAWREGTLPSTVPSEAELAYATITHKAIAHFLSSSSYMLHIERQLGFLWEYSYNMFRARRLAHSHHDQAAERHLERAKGLYRQLDPSWKFRG